MIKVIQFSLCFSILLLLCACEGGTTFTKSINNTSSETLTVTAYTVYSTGNEVVLNPNEEKEVYWNDFMGRFTGDDYTCTNDIDSIVITTASGKVVTKNLLDANNWTRESKDGRNSREDCTIDITDEDFQ